MKRKKSKPRIVSTRPRIPLLSRISVETGISFLLKALLLLTIPVEIYNGEYAIATGVLITLIVSLLPSMLSRSLQINLPWEIDLIITLVVFAHAFLGYFLDLYHLVPGFDKFLHFASTAMISILSFMIYYSFYFTGYIRLRHGALFLFIILTATALGGFWEIIEYTIDNIFHTRMQDGLDDTMWDLIFDVIGGVIAAILGYLYIKYSRPAYLRRFAIPIARVFGIRRS